jgi:hypothetical protein
LKARKVTRRFGQTRVGLARCFEVWNRQREVVVFAFSEPSNKNRVSSRRSFLGGDYFRDFPQRLL